LAEVEGTNSSGDLGIRGNISFLIKTSSKEQRFFGYVLREELRRNPLVTHQETNRVYLILLRQELMVLFSSHDFFFH